MSADDGSEQPITKRDFIYIATGSMAIVGAAAFAWPFIDSMNPSASVEGMASVEVPISAIAELIDPQRDADRVQNVDWLVVVEVCTHLGCIPLGQREGNPKGEWGGWFCPPCCKNQILVEIALPLGFFMQRA